jgi:dATP pyrophosphohydrolase
MTRAPFQILVFPYQCLADGTPRYAVFRRNEEKGGYWQGIAGGGEDGETPSAAAQREAAEEAGIPPRLKVFQLDAMCMIPVVDVCGGFTWGPNVLVVPEYAFGVGVDSPDLRLSEEHAEYRWVDHQEALGSLRWDSNKTALWELHHRLMTGRMTI